MLHIYCAEQVLYAALDMDDSLGDVRRQIAYGESAALSPLPLIFSYKSEKSLCGAEENDIDDVGTAVGGNGGGLFSMMANLYRHDPTSTSLPPFSQSVPHTKLASRCGAGAGRTATTPLVTTEPRVTRSTRTAPAQFPCVDVEVLAQISFGLSLKTCCWLWMDSYLKLYIIVKHCFQPIIKRHTVERHVAKQLSKQQQEQQTEIAGADSAAAAARAGGEGEDEVDDVPVAGPLERWLLAEDRRYLWVWTINALSDFLHRR